jgi:hypothetical protein
MAYNFLACDRDQAFLLPPDLRDWLPADQLAWFVRDVVDQLDLGPFLKAYRADGHGRAPTSPRRCSAYSSTRTRSACGPPGRSSGAAPRTSPSGCWPAIADPTM